MALVTNADDDAINLMIERFAKALHARCSALNLPYSIEFSYGLVAYEPLKHASVEDMLHDADNAMYKNKNSKRHSG